MHLHSINAAAIGFGDTKFEITVYEAFAKPWQPAQLVHKQSADRFVVVIVGQFATEVIVEVFYSGQCTHRKAGTAVGINIGPV